MGRMFFVVKETHAKKWVAEFGMYLWTMESRERVTSPRETMEEANADFVALGLTTAHTWDIYCQDIKNGKSWVRFIVQNGII